MARGQTVGALWAAMGLDLSSLDSDFAMADKTIKDAMIRLNTEKRAVVIKAETDINGLDEAKDKVKILRIQEQSLTEQIDIQRQKVAIADAVYKQMVATKGADAVASQSLRMRLLNERKAYSELESQIHKTQKAQSENTGGGLVGALRNKAIAGQSMLPGIAGNAIGLLGMATSPAGLVIGGVTAATYAMAKSVSQAVSAGNSVYVLAQKMHTTNAEAAQMSRVFRLAGADANDAVPAIVRLDKSVQSAGEAGNDTTRMLQVFGVNLRDANGNLLPVNDQLTELAKGYRNAAAAGMESEYVSQVLGARGAALVPVLENLTDLQKQAADISTTGLLNPDAAHQLSIEWNKMRVEGGQLGGAVGAALLPIAQEIMPSITQATKDLVQSISDNKQDIKDFVGLLSDIGGTVVDGIKLAGSALNDIGINAGNAKTAVKELDDVLKDIGTTYKATKDAFTAPVIPKMSNFAPNGKSESISDFLGLPSANNNLFKPAWQLAKMAFYFTSPKHLAAAGNTTPEQPADTRMPEISDTGSNTSAGEEAPTKSPEEIRAELKALEEQKKLQQEAEAAAKRAAATNKEIQEEIYNATHSELERELHDIDLKSLKYKEEGGDEVSITEMAEDEKAKIIQDFNDNTMAQIRKAWKSELQNRLDDIDREKRAWIQKGVDEVTATRWAEHEKTKARQDEALSMFRENREYLNIMRNAMAGSGDRQQMMNNARMAMLEHMREKMGIQNDFTTPEEVSMFSELMNEVKRNLVPGLEEDQWARNYRSSSVEIIRGNKVGYEFPNMTISVNYPHVEGGGNIEVIRGITAAMENGVNRAKQMSDYGYSSEG